jgi:K+-sensing histidine kinase KdpD
MTVNMTGNRVKTEENILLVDDDISFLKVAQGILNAKGYAIKTAENGSQALAEVNRCRYALVILDMHLPDMSGLELLTSINRIQPDIISVILTGYSSIENSVQSLNMGAFAYLEKPINPDRLMETLTRGLEKQKLLMENRRLLKELEQRNRDLNILLTVSQAVSCSLNPQQIISSAINIIAKSLAIEASYMLNFPGVTGIDPGFYGFNAKTQELLQETDYRSSVLKNVFQFGEHIVIQKLKNDNNPLTSGLFCGGYRSLLAVPMSSAKDPDGILMVATLNEHDFTPLEINLFKALGRETSFALKNISLMQEAADAKVLRELDAMRTQLLANVSHELRTPLAAIKGFASSLLQKDITFDEETRTSFIQTIDSESDRLSHLIDELLLMSRIEAGVFKANKNLYDMSEIVASIRDRLFAIAVKHHLKISVPDNLPSLMVDGSRIGEVITNLVENAVKYSPEGTQISLTIEEKDDSVITSIQDQGMGIPLEYQAKVFERFFQLPGQNGQRKGSGLGLCICRGIIENHNGKIWITSEPGKGSRFSFSLPVEKEEPQKT